MERDVFVSVHDAIVIACHDADMSIAELAEAADMHKNNLYRAMHNLEGSNMKVSTLVRLLENLGAVLKVETEDGKHEVVIC